MTFIIQEPRSAAESFTIIKAKSLLLFSRVVGGLAGTIAIASQAGLLSFIPKEYEKPVSFGIVLVGLGAMAAGNEKQGSAIIDERLRKKDLFTESGKLGANKNEALYTAFFSGAQKIMVEKALSGQLVDASRLDEVKKSAQISSEQLEGVLDRKLAAIAPVPATLTGSDTSALKPQEYLA